MKHMKTMALCVLALLFSAAASAEAPFQFAAPGTRAPDDPDVGGVRLPFLHGRNENMRGFDFGLLSVSESTNRSGFAFILGLSKTTGKSSGLNSALVLSHTGEATGMNAAFINSVQTLTSGVNIGFLNITDGYSAIDISGIGVSDRSGIQLGFVNITKKIEKFQFGFLNIAENGFLPVFPIFNFPKK